MTKNLMEGLLLEMNRVRDVIKTYEQLPNGAGFLGASLMKVDIQRAEQAISEGDAIKILVAYYKLKEIGLKNKNKKGRCKLPLKNSNNK